MTRRTEIIWLFSSAIIVYLLVTIVMGGHKSRPAEDAATDSDMATATPRDPSSNEQSGSFYLEGYTGQWRVKFRNGPGSSVRGWPSKGGHYALGSCLTVEMDFLKLDRFKDADRPRDSPSAEADEEAHCQRMRQLGARWWPSPHDEAMWWFSNPEESWPLEKPITYFGWPPKGGVWALNTTLIGASDMGAGRINVAITMEERCKVLEDLGAVYYTNPEDCPLLDLSDEAVPRI
ncbi:hypothetical protein LA080_006929 [Diaporthe eres]|nr:hypothetical protein LA080_006929 [Diaporthe eres]